MKSLHLIAAAGAASGALGCPGGAGEAADPRDILGDDLEHQDVDGTEGTDRSGDVARDPQPRGVQVPLATRADCEAAARHLEGLGVELAIAEEKDPRKQALLRLEKQALVTSPAADERVAQSAQDCLQNGTTRREASCIQRARSEAHIDQCAQAR